MKKIEWFETIKLGSRIYNAKSKKTGTYVGSTQSGNYSIYLIQYDGNLHPSRVNWMDAKQLGYDHLYLVDCEK